MRNYPTTSGIWLWKRSETPDEQGLYDIVYVFENKSDALEIQEILSRLSRPSSIDEWEAKDYTFSIHNINTGETTTGNAEGMRQFPGVHHLEKGVALWAKSTTEEMLECVEEMRSIRDWDNKQDAKQLDKALLKEGLLER